MVPQISVQISDLSQACSCSGTAPEGPNPIDHIKGVQVRRATIMRNSGLISKTDSTLCFVSSLHGKSDNQKSEYKSY